MGTQPRRRPARAPGPRKPARSSPAARQPARRRLLIWRHGQTDHNASGIWQGQLDTALSDLGRAQAPRGGGRARVVRAGR